MELFLEKILKELVVFTEIFRGIPVGVKGKISRRIQAVISEEISGRNPRGIAEGNSGGVSEESLKE